MGAVRRVAEKLPGVTGVDIDLAAQKVGARRGRACKFDSGSLCRYTLRRARAHKSAVAACHLPISLPPVIHTFPDLPLPPASGGGQGQRPGS